MGLSSIISLADPPPVVLRPDNVSSIPGDDVILNCVARSSVQFNVTWLRHPEDPLPVDLIDRLIVFNNGSAVIRFDSSSILKSHSLICRPSISDGRMILLSACNHCTMVAEGPSIKYVTLSLANFDLPLSRFVIYLGPTIFSRPSTKNPYKSPLYKFSLNCSRGFFRGVLSEGLLSGRFCPWWFLSVPPSVRIHLLQHHFTTSLYISCFICMIKKIISATSHALDPSPVTNCHTFSDPFPSIVTYFMDGLWGRHQFQSMP